MTQVPDEHVSRSLGAFLEGLPAFPVALPLSRIALVLPAVILDQNLEASVYEISACNESAVLAVDVDVDFGNWQSRELEHQPHIGLLG